MFFRRSLGLFAAMAMVSAALAGPGLSVLFTDDFNDGDDAGWVPADLIGGTTYDASSGSYTITTVPLPPLPFTVGAASFVAASLGDHAFCNSTFRTRVRFENAATNVTLIGRSTAESPPAHFYSFILNNANPSGNFIQIIRVDDDFGAPVQLAFAPFEVTEGVDYYLVARMTGELLMLTVWRADDQEPSQPQLAAEDSTYKSQTAWGIAIFNQDSINGGSGGALSATFDDVIITRGAKP
jgi:hypothetical protein